MAIENQNVAEQIQQEEIVQPTEEKSSASPETQVPPQEQQEDNKDYNFKQLREGKKQLEDEVKRLKNQMDTFAEAQVSTQQKDEDTLQLAKDDLVEGRHLEKLKSDVEKMLYEKELAGIPDRLKSRFSDFDEVVSEENIKKLELTEPELYRSITSGNDFFAKGVSAYKTLKALGIYKAPEEYAKQKDQVQSNHNKPMSVQAIKGQGALHEANIFAQGLTPDLKKQLQKEMAEAAKAR